MRCSDRTDLPIPNGHIGLGDAFDQALAALENVKQLAKDLAPEAWTISERSAVPPEELNLEVHQLERVTIRDRARAIAVVRQSRELKSGEGIGTSLRAPCKEALKRADDARRRVEQIMRKALACGLLRALAYHPNGSDFGEIPDRNSWLTSSWFPGLETFVDPDTSPGPSVGGSPIFLETRAFRGWLTAEVSHHGDPRLRTGKRGRPTAIPLILEEHGRRKFEGTDKTMVPEEAAALLAWFEACHPTAKAPALKTIRDNLRRRF